MSSRLPSSRWRGLGTILSTLLIAGCISERSDSEQDRSQEQLESLPYLTWVSAGDDLDKSGVTIFDQDQASPGLNLFSPRNRPQALLVDMNGEVVHSWRARIKPGDSWQHVELLPDGALLAVITERRLLKIGRRSKLIWSLEEPVHHDIAVAEDGRILTLLRGERSVDIDGGTVSILDDSIAIVSSEGELMETVSIFDFFGDQVTESRWQTVRHWLSRPETVKQTETRRSEGKLPFPHGSPVDVFHTNSIEIIPRDVDGFAQKGDLLISIRELDQIAVVDLQTREIRWRWGPEEVRRQHQPTLLDNDNLLVFDNKGAGTKVSRVIELEPRSKQIVWEYLGDPPESFFSALRSGNQRLPNGNTLITEADKGKVFEVTTDGDIVWEYYVPIINRKKKSRVSVYRMTRFPVTADILSWLHDSP